MKRGMKCDQYGNPLIFDASGISAVECVLNSKEYRTIYTGTMGALIGAGVATAEQFPTGVDGDKMWTKSGGYAGSGKNPSQRWKVRRLRKADLFEVHRYHEKRPIEHSFQRFMVQAMRPAQ